MSQPAHIDRYRLRPADERHVGDQRENRKQNRPNWIGMHDRVERNATEQPRSRIAKPISGPRMRRFVDGEGKQQDDERDENLSEVDVQQELTFNRRDRRARREERIPLLCARRLRGHLNAEITQRPGKDLLCELCGLWAIVVRLRPTREKRKDRIGHSGADD